MSTGGPINSVGEFFAHAIAIEREAAERYLEFARHMKDQAQDTAELFGNLAREGFDHARELAVRATGIPMAPIESARYSWLDQGTPLPAAHEWLFRLMSPREALGIAVRAEERAKRFFEHVARTTEDPGVMVLAQTFCVEEGDHIARMRRVLARMPNPILDWESIYAHGGPTNATASKPAPAATGRARPAARSPAEERKPARKSARASGRKVASGGRRGSVTRASTRGRAPLKSR